MREIMLLDAPTNLGLRPPREGWVPGCYKMPWALRDAGLLRALQATDAGNVVPPRYSPDWRADGHTRNSAAIRAYSLALSARVQALLDAGGFPLLVGGDCSVLFGPGHALKRRGRHGLVFIDAHSDFRHPGNSDRIDAAAGEDLAVSLGLGDPALVDLAGDGPNFRADDVAMLGVRANDEHLAELRERGIQHVHPAQVVDDVDGCVRRALSIVTGDTSGFWVHVDFDVVDSREMSAVDSPEPDGLSFALLAKVLRGLVAHPACVGMECTIYDPDLDLDGSCAARIVGCLQDAFNRM